MVIGVGVTIGLTLVLRHLGVIFGHYIRYFNITLRLVGRTNTCGYFVVRVGGDVTLGHVTITVRTRRMNKLVICVGRGQRYNMVFVILGHVLHELLYKSLGDTTILVVSYFLNTPITRGRTRI